MDLPDVEARDARPCAPSGTTSPCSTSWIRPSASCRRAAKRCSSIPRASSSVPASVADVRAAYRNTVDEVIGEWRTMFGALGHRLRGRLDRRAVRRSAAPRVRRCASSCRELSRAAVPAARRRDRRSAAHPSDAAPHRRARRFPGGALSRARREGAQPHAADQKSLIDVAARACAARHRVRGGAAGGALGRRRPRADGARHRHRQLAQLVGRRQRASAARPNSRRWRATCSRARRPPIACGS